MMLPLNPAFLSGDVGTGEVLFVCAVILVFLGPRRLPEIARTLGRVINELRRASSDFQDQIMRIDVESPPAVPLPRALPDSTETSPEFDGPTSGGGVHGGEPSAGLAEEALAEPGVPADAGVPEPGAAAEEEPDAGEQKTEGPHGAGD